MTSSWKPEYIRHMVEHNMAGSNKASSYIRALDLLDSILAHEPAPFPAVTSVWQASSVAQLRELYAYILDQQRIGESGLFAGHEVPSYWRSGFYSAAIRSLIEFVIIHHHEQKLWGIYGDAATEATTLARRLEAQPLDEATELVDDRHIDFTTKEGREVLRVVRTRVNQDFFRKMVLANYSNRCCLTCIPVPQVLRASHIIPWAEDESNRMNPANGLCLSATYDAAFDAHLISFDEQMRLILSPSLRDYMDNDSFQQHFKELEGVHAAKPAHYLPDQALMAKHREHLAA